MPALVNQQPQLAGNIYQDANTHKSGLRGTCWDMCADTSWCPSYPCGEIYQASPGHIKTCLWDKLCRKRSSGVRNYI